MSALLAILGKFWPYLLPLVVGLFLGGYVVYKWEHGQVTRAQNALSSYKAETLADARVTAAEAAAKTIELQNEADQAHNAFLQEQSDNAAYRASHPIGDVRLCLSSPKGGGVPKAASAGSGGADTSPGPVQPVHAGDSGVRTGAGPPIQDLLDFFASTGERVAAQARECQKRASP